MMEKVIQLSSPITISLAPNEVQVIVIALKRMPYENVATLLEKLLAACQPKPVKKK
jgi:hypothetical protein